MLRTMKDEVLRALWLSVGMDKLCVEIELRGGLNLKMVVGKWYAARKFPDCCYVCAE
jgi:hypothetical protein